MAKPVEIQIDELGNNVTAIYEFVGDMDDNKAPGLERIFNYISDNFFARNEGAGNQHIHNTTKNSYFQKITTYNSNIINNPQTYTSKNHRHTDDHDNNKNKMPHITYVTNNINKRSNTVTNGSALNSKKDCTTTKYYNDIQTSHVY